MINQKFCNVENVKWFLTECNILRNPCSTLQRQVKIPTRPYQQRWALKTLNQPLEISPALAKIIGTTKEETIHRKEVIKKHYVYIKEQNLQDPEEKTYFTPYKMMEPFFGS